VKCFAGKMLVNLCYW